MTLLEGDDIRDILPAVTRQVSRGEVSLPWGSYFNKALSLHGGEQVTVFFEPTNGEQVWISDMNGHHICEATRDGNARPYVSASQMDHARARRERAQLERLQRKVDAVTEEANPGRLTEQPIDNTLNELAQQHLAQMREEFEAAPAFVIPNDDPARYQLWKTLATRDALEPEEQAFYDSFSASNYCTTMQQLEAEFDEALSQ